MDINTYLRDSSFPDVRTAPGDQPIAWGGDLELWRLLDAYTNGIFPWFSEDSPIFWWSPDPRFVLYPDQIRVSRSMEQELRRQKFTVTMDNQFYHVIRACQQPRRGQDGTWITEDIVDSYLDLHKFGVAHSVEVWLGSDLVGGLYGVSLGKTFFGESMFSRQSNASKMALILLTRLLHHWQFNLIDCQVYTSHLESMGAQMIPRDEFLDTVQADIQKHPTRVGSWQLDFARFMAEEVHN